MLEPLEYRVYLSDDSFSHLLESCKALDDRQYFASAVWGGVFLEALLEDLARAWGLGQLPPKQDDLNGRIDQLRGLSKNPQWPHRVLDDALKRCDEVRSIRNRLVHSTGAVKENLKKDAEFINSGLSIVLKWYKSVVPPSPSESPAPPSEPLAPGVRVFVSTITPHTVEQEYFLDGFLERLRGIGVEPIRLLPGKYPPANPVAKVRDTIQTCEGMVVIGLERTHVYFLRDKEGARKKDDEKEDTHRQYTSGWLHLEAGIASALGLKVFVLCQSRIHNDGIFDDKSREFTFEKIDTLDASSSDLDEFLADIENWAKERSATATPDPAS
jgi:hypothetical protein